MALRILSANSFSRIQSLANVFGNSVLPASITGSKSRVASLYSVSLQGENYRRSAYEPWDYENKPYGILQTIYESTTKRFDDNSKIIVVEGNIGTEKAKIGKRIAEEFDMLFMPDATEEDVFVLNGFDFRNLNEQLVKGDRFVDLMELYHAKDPKEVLGFGRTQLNMYKKRYDRYRQALKHLFATGQGVVLERSYVSDRVFADALRKFRYFTWHGKEFYIKNYEKSMKMQWKPHMCVYIDQSVGECRELIAKRNNPIEQGSVLLTDDYLYAIEESYRKNVLPIFEQYCHVLYLNTDDLDKMDEVCYEMQNIDLDPPVMGDKYKFADWYRMKEYMWNNKRMIVDVPFSPLEDYFFEGLRPIHCEELDIQDRLNYQKIVYEHPAYMAQAGYMPPPKEPGLIDKWDERFSEWIEERKARKAQKPVEKASA